MLLDSQLILYTEKAVTVPFNVAVTVPFSVAVTVPFSMTVTVPFSVAVTVPFSMTVTVPFSVAVTVPFSMTVTVPFSVAVTVPFSVAVTVPFSVAVTVPFSVAVTVPFNVAMTAFSSGGYCDDDQFPSGCDLAPFGHKRTGPDYQISELAQAFPISILSFQCLVYFRSVNALYALLNLTFNSVNGTGKCWLTGKFKLIFGGLGLQTVVQGILPKRPGLVRWSGFSPGKGFPISLEATGPFRNGPVIHISERLCVYTLFRVFPPLFWRQQTGFGTLCVQPLGGLLAFSRGRFFFDPPLCLFPPEGENITQVFGRCFCAAEGRELYSPLLRRKKNVGSQSYIQHREVWIGY